MSYRRAVLALDRLYSELPRLDCKGLCADSCGPIVMSRVEWDRIGQVLGHKPQAKGIDCPMLAAGRCTVYDVRPAICRLWGIAEEMPCPFGCKPERTLSKPDAFAWLDRVGHAGR